MKPRHKVSSQALELIKGYEGLRTQAARLPDGRWTVGYGHTRSAREGARVSAEDAEALLLYDVRGVAAAVNASVFAPLNQNQFDALVAFAFNVGVEAFRTSNVLRRLNAGEPLQAASALDSWRRAEFEGEPQVIDALVRRRAAEKALFLTPPDGPVVVPTPVLPPQIDWSAPVLSAQPLELVSPLDGDPTPVRAPEPEPPVRPAPAQAADAAVERLRTLFPDSRTPGEPAADAGPSPFPPEPAPVPERVAPAVPVDEPLDLDPARQVAPPSPTAEPPEAHALAPTPEPVEPERPAERWPYLLLFLGGAVLFVAGVSASMEGRAVLGLPLSLAGTACIAVAVYFLLKRIDRAG